MGVTQETIKYACDWVNEFGHICEYTQDFSSSTHKQHARDVGWGAYSNAYIRRSRWTTGAESWFCPIHATVFRNNHGWGGLEDYEVPTNWWKSFYYSKFK